MSDWSSGAAYEPYVGRWSRLVAREFLAWLAVPTGARWVDVGCGTGALTSTVSATAAPKEVVGVDLSLPYVGYAAAHHAGAAFVAGNAMALPIRTAWADATVSGLALNFVPDPARAAGEMRRVTKPGGTVAAYVWDYAGEGSGFIRSFWDAAAEVDPGAKDHDEGSRFPLCAEEPLALLFAGLDALTVESITVPMVFRDFADLWDPFHGAQGPAATYLAALPPETQDAVRDRLRDRLPTRPDGSIPLTARAWAVKGIRRAD